MVRPEGQRSGRMRRRAVRRAPALALATLLGGVAVAADGPIEDNSFLIEEAYNQEPGVVQHISTLNWNEESASWQASFTQEWPVTSQRHQLSYTLLYLDASGSRGWGDAAVNYRFQVRGIEGGPVAIAPRLTLLLPTGDAREGLGAGAPGLQVNLPVSARLAERWVGHWNAGTSFVRDAEGRGGAEADLTAVNLGQSLIWLARPRLNILLEASWTSAEAVVADGGTERERAFFVSPGLRFAIDRASGLQIVPGLALPVGVGPSAGEWSIFFYLSLEHPF